jgi:hypothetical protein
MENDTIIEAPQCPRCLGFIPRNDKPGQYMGALSRADNKTQVCSDCGTEEAIVALVAVDEWPISLYTHPACDAARARHIEADALIQSGKVRYK